MIVNKKNSINKIIEVDGDKSISHRGIFFGSISEGRTTIENFLLGEDCLHTIDCFRKMGVKIEINENKIIIDGVGLYGLKKPKDILYVGNSGTTIRLLSGLLTGQNFDSCITGDKSIIKRPMMRIIEPLTKMNGCIYGENDLAPLNIKKSNLTSINYTLPIASAQVKSAIIFSSLYTNGVTKIIEPTKCRNHTEIMLKYFGGVVDCFENETLIYPKPTLVGKNIFVPNDISSASFFIVLALISKNSSITIKNVGVNETRTGIIDALLAMNGNIKLSNIHYKNGEKIADITAKSSDLISTNIYGDIIPRMIDEIPIFVIASLFAKGKTVIKDATELKVKESNRISTIINELSKIGANIIETDDGMIINNVDINNLKGCTVNSYNDHRIAMSLVILGTIVGNIEVKNSDCINISFPSFKNIINII